MNDLSKRVCGYGATLLVGGALVYGGFIYEAEPDVMTLLGSVDIKLQLASSMPAVDKEGKRVELRDRLIAESLGQLERAEKQEPGNAGTESYRAFIDYLEGRYVEAASRYATVRTLDGCEGEMRDQSFINQARMLRLAGRDADARVLLVDAVGNLSEKYATAAKNEMAGIDRAASRADSDSQKESSPPAQPSK